MLTFKLNGQQVKEMSNLLKRIIDYYLTSPDFNGIPIYEIEDYDPEEVQDLIVRGLVEAIFDDFNPHIKRFNQKQPIKEQLKGIRGGHEVCLYPTPHALLSVKRDESRPYTSLLQSGWGQYEILYFEVEVLEQYFNDPRYAIFDLGYRGSISYVGDNIDGDFIKDYGMAYPANYTFGNEIDRAVAVFIHDLSHLSGKSQMKWKSREIECQYLWRVNSGFIKNLVYGQWVTDSWIYDDLLREQAVINKICDVIGIDHIFSRIWDGENYWSRPVGYRTILFPTRKNYCDFVNVLEKIVCNNISIKAFTKEQNHTNAVCREREEGSIAVLGKWLKANGRNPQMVDGLIVEPLKKLRKLRQIPAHKIESDVYDKTVYRDQNELIKEVYLSIHYLRIMLGTHPLAESVEVPSCLNDETHIAIY